MSLLDKNNPNQPENFIEQPNSRWQAELAKNPPLRGYCQASFWLEESLRLH